MDDIKKINLHSLRTEESFEFNRIAAIEFEKCTDELLKPLKDKHRQKFIVFDESLKKKTFILESKELTEYDHGRDNAYKILSLVISYSLGVVDAARAAVAAKADNILSRYGNPTKLPYMQESGVLENLIQDMEKELSAADMELLGISIFFNDLKQHQSNFTDLFDDRNVAQGTVETGATKEARRETEQAYTLCVQCLNTLIAAKGLDAYKDIVNTLNNLIDYQKTIIKARKTRNKK